MLGHLKEMAVIPQPVHTHVWTHVCAYRCTKHVGSPSPRGFLAFWRRRFRSEEEGRGLYVRTHLLFYHSRTKLSVIRKDIFELQTISSVLINLLDSSSWPQHNFRALLRKEHKHHSWLGPFSTLGGLLLTDTAILHFLSPPPSHPTSFALKVTLNGRLNFIFMHLIPVCLCGLLANHANQAFQIARHPESLQPTTKLQPSPFPLPCLTLQNKHI